ncbi:fibroblast growth factor receptor 4-like [Dendronephthya gigantea]|uniref:fibroblast growth factor receptor 4-like n=1 Tax=Dendronephthya gigantea TaxID=151771 RepID=UPI00106A987D|nr:fibroblast growth factor receptor 4-like [Dendronephthya gigantea]
MTYNCTAKNAAGKATKTLMVFQTEKPEEISDQNSSAIPIVAPVSVLSMIILTFLCLVMYKRKKLYGGLYLFSHPPLLDSMETIPSPFFPEWEFPREKIKFVRQLGAGQFGVVWLAEATGISLFHPRETLREKQGKKMFFFFNRTRRKANFTNCKEINNVAVKQVKADYVESSVADIKDELQILIHVGEHENIVNILGACTKGKSSNLWIILEYCPHGNLKELLRQSRDRYRLEEDLLVKDLSQNFGPKNLMCFALQIAKGMEFLVSRKIIHRDLAARNILIGNEYVAKVADFGLARNVDKYQIYIKKSTGMVPVKWLAIESIEDAIFTEKSDVWSFGVLLWEIFALGGNPYPGVHINDFYLYLLNGNRMQPPIHCPPKIFDIMSLCWKENPIDRPNFCNLIKLLGENLGFIDEMQETISDNGGNAVTSC